MRNVIFLVEILNALLGFQLSEEGVALLLLRMPVRLNFSFDNLLVPDRA